MHDNFAALAPHRDCRRVRAAHHHAFNDSLPANDEISFWCTHKFLKLKRTKMPAVAMVTHSSDLRTHAGVYGLSWLMLWSSRGFGRLLAITFVEAIDASCGIDQLLFSGKERMASGTDFDVQVTFASRAGLESFAASAGDRDFNVFGVNSWFHLLHSLSAAPSCSLQTRHDTSHLIAQSSLAADLRR